MDLTGALLTPVKTLCCFETKDGGNDMVHMGTSLITLHHHIHTAGGWMTALQAADKGQGVILSSTLERVYNLCLEGGGNILINTSSQPEAMILTPAATMGYLFTPASGSQQYSSLTYPKAIQMQLGLRQDLSYGHAQFRSGAVETLPNGTLIFNNITGDMPQKKPRIPLLDKSPGANLLKQSVSQPLTNLNKTQTSGVTAQDNRKEPLFAPSDASSFRSPSTDIHGAREQPTLGTSQPKSNTAYATRELELSSTIANQNPHPLKNRHSDTTGPSHSLAETQPVQAVVQEYRLTPSFTPDTHILVLEAGRARWTQIRDARPGAIVIQSLPSGNTGDVHGAQLATLERVWIFEGGGDDIDIVQIGKAYFTAHHPILTADGWILASQAAAKGYGKFPSDREYSHLFSLQLTTGGNILINTSTSQDLSSVYIEAATMGYRFSSSSDPLHGNSPTYAPQATGLRDGSVAPTKPSYSQVTALSLLRLSKRPSLPPALLTPETHASPQFLPDSTKTAKGHKGEPITDIYALGATTAQRTPEKYSGDLDVARTGSHGIRPTGNQKSCREATQGDDPGGVDEGHEVVRRTQDNRDGSTAIEAQSHRGSTSPLPPRLPVATSSGLNKEQIIQGLIKRIMHDGALSHQDKQVRVQAIWAGKADGVKDTRAGSDGTAADVHSQGDTTDTTNTTCHVTPAIGTPANSANVPHPQPGGSGGPGTYPDILIQTPRGEGVPEH